ncbi:hypothetical protein Dacet_0536 [Denitrovibrio acetiphilus DSM 12809]|uniref:HNH endonuclease 5 domain-containing protein n=1 Tax=Denitrovibrio acetiphilus (strain DSM 12809 / NBRC 114555 / N2460) TaxID=522772 RepID=D4H423_DENA2|nr:hypothetical protein [Denitrovibrio acetiphilus]ADD67334.1 hypothetical protein Dacet_0536 [Denitrovibrio acetiphilus DSM 12809]
MVHGKSYIRKLHEGSQHGFCRLCGEEKDLSEDHIPPKCFGNKSPVKIVSENGREFTSRNGLKFKTICRDCNSKLGRYDKELEVIYNKLSVALNIPSLSSIIIEVSTHSLIKALIGHLLSLVFYSDDPKNELKEPLQNHFPIFESLRDYYINGKKLKNFDFYYWFYPNNTTKIIQYIYSAKLPNDNSVIAGHILKFHPIAFFILDKNTSTVVPKANKLDLSLIRNNLVIDMKHYPNINFPEIPHDNFFVLYNNTKHIIAKK